MKRLQSKVITLSIAMIWIGNLQAMSPTMRQQERAERTREFYHHVVSELGLEKYVPLGENIPVHEDFEQSLATIGTMDYVLPTLTQLRIMGLSKEQVVELIFDWRNEGHLFPDERFDNYSVANALVKYAANLFGIPLSDIGYLFQHEPTYQIGGGEYPESAIYAMTPKERGELLVVAANSPANVDIIQKLINWDADVNIQNQDGYTALIWAAKYNNTEALQELLAAGADPNIKGGIYKETALIAAVPHNNTEALQALLGAGAKVNIQDRGGSTALMLAAANNLTEALRVLLGAGAKVNIRDGNGRTALDMARQNNYDNIVRLLCNHGSTDSRCQIM